MKNINEEEISFILNHLGEERENYFNAVAPPIIQSSNFAFDTVQEFRNGFNNSYEIHTYSRGNNPTVEILRKKMAALEHTEDALVFASGAAAISSAIIPFVKSGDHIVCIENPYNWTAQLISKLLSKFGVEYTFIDATNNENIEKSIRPNTKVLFLESPNSFTYEIQDLTFCAEFAKKHGLISIIDNSYSSPIYQNPADFGIDLVVHSGSKYINGHSDVILGVICGSKNLLNLIFSSPFMTLGAVLSPNDAYLAIRGLRTLPIRIKRSDESAKIIISELKKHPKVLKIYHPFDDENPQRELAMRQMRGTGGMFSARFDVNDFDLMEEFCNRITTFTMAVSWGAYESLMVPTCAFYQNQNKNKPAQEFNLIRFYVGLEDPYYLLSGINEALKIL